MAAHSWLLFSLAILMATVSPGPNVLIVVVNALRHGAFGARWTIIGNLCCLFCVAVLASVGVGAAIAATPIAYQIMKIAGGIYLAWLGFKLIRSSFGAMQAIDVSEARMAKTKATATGLFTEAFLVSASNPKSIIFLTAIFPQFLNIDAPIIPQFAIMFVSLVAIVSVIHGGYALFAVSMRERPLSVTARRWLARATGSTFIGLGAGVALAK